MNLTAIAAPAAIIGGVILVGAAVGWRLRARRRALASLQLVIEDADPIVRTAALRVLGSRGLGNFAELLVHRALVETDAAVRQTLAAMVRQNDWEPADTRDLLTLRVWAHAQPITDPGPAPAPPRTEPEVVAVDAPLATGGRRGRGSHAPVHAGRHSSGDYRAAATASHYVPQVPPRLAPRRDGEPHDAPAPLSEERVTAIVTGAGGPAGIAVVRALVAAGHRVVAADIDPLAAGLRLAHGGAVIPTADDPEFVPALCRLAVASAAQVIVPTVAEELLVLAEAGRHMQADAGVRMWVPSAAAVQTCSDKWQFAQLLGRHGILAPVTGHGSAENVPGPWVVKPRFGRGSRDVYLVDRPEEMATILGRVADPIVQTRLNGREFTVDVLVAADGILAGAVPRWRLETKAGISTKGRTFRDDRLVREVARLLSLVGLCGPANVQGFVDHEGTPWFVEVNPRFSGGLPLSLAAGADLVGEYVRAVLGQSIRPERLTFRPGVTMIRHFEETFE